MRAYRPRDHTVVGDDVADGCLLTVNVLDKLLRKHVALGLSHGVEGELVCGPGVAIATERIAHHIGIAGGGAGQVDGLIVIDDLGGQCFGSLERVLHRQWLLSSLGTTRIMNGLLRKLGRVTRSGASSQAYTQCQAHQRNERLVHEYCSSKLMRQPSSKYRARRVCRMPVVPQASPATSPTSPAVASH